MLLLILLYIYIYRALSLEPLHVFSQRWQHKLSLMRRSHVKIARWNVFTILGAMATFFATDHPATHPFREDTAAQHHPFHGGIFQHTWIHDHLASPVTQPPTFAYEEPAIQRAPESAKVMSTSFAILGAQKIFRGSCDGRCSLMAWPPLPPPWRARREYTRQRLRCDVYARRPDSVKARAALHRHNIARANPRPRPPGVGVERAKSTSDKIARFNF